MGTVKLVIENVNLIRDEYSTWTHVEAEGSTFDELVMHARVYWGEGATDWDHLDSLPKSYQAALEDRLHDRYMEDYLEKHDFDAYLEQVKLEDFGAIFESLESTIKRAGGQ